ncbi:hypothetical protein AB6A40_001481 [Gnathostoma spinigerum]|uniref:Phospholipase A2 n=1 Tax=Gnathostoma spinigerum TaxID=75299 RepID=A0ABD6E6B9_9BILA
MNLNASFLVALSSICMSIALGQLISHSKAMWNIEGMSECLLQFSALYYNNYGCYCGFGGKGVPVDDIDRCCEQHDRCYESALECGYCYSSLSAYVAGYDWSCEKNSSYNDVLVCPDDHKYTSPCSYAICLCDKQLVECWAKYPHDDLEKGCPPP